MEGAWRPILAARLYVLVQETLQYIEYSERYC